MAETAQADAVVERAPSIDERYGRTPSRTRRTRWLVVGLAAIMVATFALWVVWTGLNNGQGNIDVQDIGHKVIDDSNVSVTWALSAPAGTAVSCAVQAQNEAHGIVGWKIVDLGASESFTRQFTENVRTSQLAVTGLIYRCWLT